MTSCSELRCSWAFRSTLYRSSSSSFSRRCLRRSRISRSFLRICSRASSLCADTSCVSETRLRRSLRSSAMTFSSMATLLTCALSSTWCSRLSFCIADFVSLTMLSSFTFVSVTSCSSFWILARAVLPVSSCMWIVCISPISCFLSCCSCLRSSDSLAHWLSRCCTSSRRFSASTLRDRWLSVSSRCWPCSFSSCFSVRSS
mmetsp:Transcript_71933/g.185542  ORF Transcript_71933/g.185542 Transcript_71933/m.185542 type:complete len:201 (+) Transcript_71933:1136-1738(+)